MSHFFNQYNYSSSAEYNSFIKVNEPAVIYAVGRLGRGALFAKLSNTGSIIWSKLYGLNSHTILLTSGVACDNGDFILYGSKIISRNNLQTLVIRVNPLGQIIWTKILFRNQTIHNVQLIKGPGDTYYMVSESSSEFKGHRAIELLKIDGTGHVLQARHIDNDFSIKVSGLIPLSTGCLLYGMAEGSRNGDGFLIAVDENLNLIWKRLIGKVLAQDIKAVIPVDLDQFVLCGETSRERNTFLLRLHIDDISYQVCTYNIGTKNSDGVRKLIKVDNHYYLIGKYSLSNFSYIAKFNATFDLIWIKRLEENLVYQFQDISSSNLHDKIKICGYFRADRTNSPIIIQADLEFNTCFVNEMPLIEKTEEVFSPVEWEPQFQSVDMVAIPIDLRVATIFPIIDRLCSNGQIDPEGRIWAQSPYCYLQVAGSDGSDNTVEGFHVRMNFLRALSQHRAKGHLSGPSGLYSSSLFFNRDNDFIKLYRTPFAFTFFTSIDLTVPPDLIDEAGTERVWQYTNLVPVSFLPSNTTNVFVRFSNTMLYDWIRTSTDPSTNPFDFIKAYSDILEIGCQGKMTMASRFLFERRYAPGPTNDGVLDIETLSLPDQLDPGSRFLSSRKRFQNLDPDLDQPKVFCENIEYFRFRYSGNMVLNKIDLLTFDDFLLGQNGISSGNWEWLGAFALSTNDNEVFNRLEDTSRFTVDQMWPKFTKDASSGEMKVNVQNYKDKWLGSDGLKRGVEKFLNLSRTDPQAVAIVPNQDSINNQSQSEISYLDLLSLVDLDFHVGTMLGVGHILPKGVEGPNEPFVFLMEYVTEAALEGQPPERISHYYLTPTVRHIDYKRPPTPVLNEVDYGMYIDNKSATPTALTDADGYTPYDDSRIINLSRQTFQQELPMAAFFATQDEFNLCEEANPVFIALDYGPGPKYSGNLVMPDLLHDPGFLDPAGLPESRPILQSGDLRFFIHQEYNTGIHHYLIHFISWFSRISLSSNEVETDYTQFPKRSFIPPPEIKAAQVIQPEQPLILTTQAQQDLYTALPGPDKTLVCVVFSVNYIHHKAHQSVDTAEFFFREQAAVEIKGRIATGPGSIQVNTTDHTVQVNTADFVIASTSPPQTITPNITLAEKVRYIGSTFAANGQTFEIIDIITSATGDYPSFVLKQIRQTHSLEDPIGSNQFCTIESFISPLEGERFTVIENLSEANQWDAHLSKEVSLHLFLPTHTELITHSDGSQETVIVGGLTDHATIAQIYNPDPSLTGNIPTGLYEIELNNASLPILSDPDVDFFQGTVRIRSYSSSEMKTLQVWSINNSGSTLKLTAYDPNFLLDPIIPASPALQSNIWINYHPDYQVYLMADTVGGNNFEAASLLPPAGIPSKETLIALRSKDSSVVNCVSYLSTPAVLLAKEIQEPETPGTPTGPLFTTAPNFDKRGSFTIDMAINNPYALLIYRSDHKRILNQLYQPLRVKEIMEDLEQLTSPDRDYFADRWRDLVNLNLDSTNNFKAYIPGGYQFPLPNNINYIIPNPDPNIQEQPFIHSLDFNDTFTYTTDSQGNTITRSFIDIVQEAINNAFIPLTETPVMVNQVNDSVFQTSDRTPAIRDANGNRYQPSDSAYDPWPMALVYEKDGSGNILQSGDTGYGSSGNQRFMRFSDFSVLTASTSSFFYYAIEQSSTLQESPRTPIVGPILAVNRSPAPAVVIRQAQTILADPSIGQVAAIRFDLNPYPVNEKIEKIDIYRAINKEDALSVRFMKKVKSYFLGDPIIDDFSDLPFPPFGRVHYRFIAQRKIIDEFGQVEYVPSQPSAPFAAEVIDNLNPPPPVLSFSSDLPIGSPILLPNVKLSWAQTTFGATYYLKKQNNLGEWVKIMEIGPDVHLNLPTIQVNLEDTDLNNSDLYKQNDDLKTIYHLFRVDLENASGLLNRTHTILKI